MMSEELSNGLDIKKEITLHIYNFFFYVVFISKRWQLKWKNLVLQRISLAAGIRERKRGKERYSYIGLIIIAIVNY